MRIARIRVRIEPASATPEMVVPFIALAPDNDAYYTKTAAQPAAVIAAIFHTPRNESIARSDLCTANDLYVIIFAHQGKPTMNDYLFLTLAEKLLELYKTKSISIDPDIRYSDEFRSLIGEIQDAISCVD